MSSLTLDSLPVEILCGILRHLDPITLIAFSQTSSHYRKVISPSKRHYAERLLALELLEQHGGVTLNFRSKHNIISPDWRDPVCDAMRWACTNCLRLLPHTAFGNHFILGLGYRKPEPGSPAAEPVSSWEPSRDVRYWQSLKQYKQRPDLVFEQKRQRLQFSGASTSNYWRYATARDAEYSGNGNALIRLIKLAMTQPPGFRPSLAEHTRGRQEMVQFTLMYERDQAGYKRHLRRCLECNWQCGELRPHTTQYDGTLGGTARVPLAHSRQLYFGCGLDRYFPGFSYPPGNERPAHNAPIFTIHRQNASDEPFTLHMVRCPGCTRWQELRAFRVGSWPARWTVGYGMSENRGDFENWDGRRLSAAFFDGLICNHCLAAAADDGMERLRDELLGFWLNCANARLEKLDDQLRKDFFMLYYTALQMSKKVACKRIIQKEILPGVLKPADVAGYKPYLPPGRATYVEPSYADLALYRLRYGQWLDAFAGVGQDEVDGMRDISHFNKGFVDCQQDILGEAYERAEEHFLWLKQCKHAVLENPQVLVDWALARDGAALT
ncbi:hypothetical protein PG996_009124 [Apiospora saccharicola]|uniref:F-box domain-containing protein n=1 Tax=Apiospora saccharicola TaxID=335842 RepID=A0ABR1UMW1_9PEZI